MSGLFTWYPERTSETSTAGVVTGSSPWSRTVRMNDGDFFFLSARRLGDEPVICSVWVDGVMLGFNSSQSDRDSCTIQGTIGQAFS